MSSTFREAVWVKPLLGLVLLLLLAGIPAAGTAPTADERPPGATTHVEVDIAGSGADDADIALHASWTTRYLARSEEEAERAQNETLDTSWFHGEEEMAAFAAKFPDAEIRPGTLQIQHLRTEGEHGQISVTKGTTVHLQFDSEDDRIELGPQLAQNLSDGDRLTVEIRHYWEPEAVTTEGERRGVEQMAYVWRIGDDPSPHFVLNESGITEERHGGDLGSGPIVAVVALALVAALLAAGAKRRDR